MMSSRLRTLDLAYIALFAILMAVCAWITLPLAVPLTLQTFGIFMAFMTLGGRRGFYAVTVYLLLGIVGLPVFSGFQGGIGVLLGTTGGYIAGFLVSGLLYWLITAKFGNTRPIMLLAAVLGLLICYLFGTLWFIAVYAHTSGPIGVMTALSWCVIPFVIPDLLKLALAFFLSLRLNKHLK